MLSNFETTYKNLFRKTYAPLLVYAKSFLGEEDSEDVVEEVFLELWKRQDTIKIGPQINSFLYRAVFTKSMNVLKHRKVKNNYVSTMEKIQEMRMNYWGGVNAQDILENKDLRKIIEDSISELPEKCQKVFKLSYLQEMTNKEIAEILDISVRTVEAHMYKALKLLRSKLQHFIVFFFFMMMK